MELRIFVLMVVISTSVAFNVERRERSARGIARKLAQVDLDGFLMKYGYMTHVPEGIMSDNLISSIDKEKERSQAIRDFQHYFGLQETGQADEKTLEMMTKPRCGVWDVERDEYGRKKRTPQRFTTLAAKWNTNMLTWKVDKFTRQLRREDQARTFREAFKLWEDVSPLQIRETRGDPDIHIFFARGEHGDGAGNAFDGRNRVLAHAFGPGKSEISGDAHFDEDEKWTLKSDEGSDLLVVAAHEFGHSLGLGHSRDVNALMFPAYQPSAMLKLGYDDIRGIQTLYGSRIQGRTRPEPRVTARPRTRPPVTRRTFRPFSRRPVTRRPATRRPATRRPMTSTPTSACNVQFDEIVQGSDGVYYAFKGSQVYKFNTDRVESEYPKDIGDVFPGAPANVDVALAMPEKSRIYILKDFRVWRYTNFLLDTDYPKDINRNHFKEKPRFALTFMDDRRSQRIMLFGSTYWWDFDFDDLPTFPPTPYRITQNWHGIPTDVRYAVWWKDDNNFYLVSETSHVVYNHHRRAPVGKNVREGLPAWMNNICLDVSGNTSITRKPAMVLLLASFVVTKIMRYWS